MSSTALANMSVTQLKGVGVQLRDKLAKLNIETVQDVLFHLPLRYQDRTRLTPIGALTPNTEAVIEGEIRAADIAFGRRRSLVCRLQDNTGITTLRFFHFSGAQKSNLKPGTKIRCYGEVRRGASGLELYHPEYQFLEGKIPLPLEQQLTPIYPAAEGLTQSRLRSIAQQALNLLANNPLDDLLPPDLSPQLPEYSVRQVLELIHNPPTNTRTDLLATMQHPAQQRLIIEELLAHHLSLLKLRNQHQRLQAPTIKLSSSKKGETALQFPFTPTQAQYRVITEITQELKRPFPMQRLLQGDVGSGKTLVAAVAAFEVVNSGFQVAIMAPTEILAEQLYSNFQQWFSPHQIRCALLTGSLKGKGREKQLAAIAQGEVHLIVGTHALFQDDVEFNNLGLVVIDEQHRFGVHQRLALRSKGSSNSYHPHQLIMTATPIPRTLSMSIYADLDCSIIDELPPGRQPVETALINSQRRAEVIERVKQACSTGAQCYWVCTLIEESEVLEAQAAEATASELQLTLAGLRIGLVHGRLKPAEKQAIMGAFKKGELQLLVATTVIEVGVDVPNARLMIIENPERLGLAQLHQLRGRVGRGREQSHCVLMYQDPLSQNAKARLSAIRSTTDGFKIAEKDLEIRGPGEVLGTRQTGEMTLKLADLQRDAYLLPQVQAAAKTFINQQPEHAKLLINRWIGNRERYAQA